LAERSLAALWKSAGPGGHPLDESVEPARADGGLEAHLDVVEWLLGMPSLVDVHVTASGRGCGGNDSSDEMLVSLSHR
jgi:hypothetical protein